MDEANSGGHGECVPAGFQMSVVAHGGRNMGAHGGAWSLLNAVHHMACSHASKVCQTEVSETAWTRWCWLHVAPGGQLCLSRRRSTWGEFQDQRDCNPHLGLECVLVIGLGGLHGYAPLALDRVELCKGLQQHGGLQEWGTTAGACDSGLVPFGAHGVSRIPVC